MKSYQFTIQGNQENRQGNPIPYVRSTRNAQWSKTNQRYHRWCEYVRGCFYEEYPEFATTRQKPIKLLKTEWAKVDLIISWADNKHADADNIFKGISDSLFVNDKEVYGSFKRFDEVSLHPRVSVELTIHTL